MLTTASEHKKWKNIDTSDQNSLDCVVYEYLCTQPKYIGGIFLYILTLGNPRAVFQGDDIGFEYRNTERISLFLERGRWVILGMKDTKALG